MMEEKYIINRMLNYINRIFIINHYFMYKINNNFYNILLLNINI